MIILMMVMMTGRWYDDDDDDKNYSVTETLLDNDVQIGTLGEKRYTAIKIIVIKRLSYSYHYAYLSNKEPVKQTLSGLHSSI